jgi:hypothetical protein
MKEIQTHNPGAGLGLARVDTTTVASMRRTSSLTRRAFGSIKETSVTEQEQGMFLPETAQESAVASC